jgi:hypothetical protein
LAKGSGSSGFNLSGFLLVQQATILDGVAFDSFSFQEHCLGSAEVDLKRDGRALPWEAIVVEKNKDMLTQRWRDYPKQPTVVRHRTAAAIATAVKPSLASSTIRARQTAFCGVLRSLTSRSSRSRSATLVEICSVFRIGADLQVRADL